MRRLLRFRLQRYLPHSPWTLCREALRGLRRNHRIFPRIRSPGSNDVAGFCRRAQTNRVGEAGAGFVRRITSPWGLKRLFFNLHIPSMVGSAGFQATEPRHADPEHAGAHAVIHDRRRPGRHQPGGWCAAQHEHRHRSSRQAHAHSHAHAHTSRCAAAFLSPAICSVEAGDYSSVPRTNQELSCSCKHRIAAVLVENLSGHVADLVRYRGIG